MTRDDRLTAVIELLCATYREHYLQELRGAREDAFWYACAEFEKLLGVQLFDNLWEPTEEELYGDR